MADSRTETESLRVLITLLTVVSRTYLKGSGVGTVAAVAALAATLN